MGRSSIICPSCKKLISGDEPLCSYCGIKRPSSDWRLLLGVFRGLPEDRLVRIIVAVNCSFFLLSLLLGPASFSIHPFSFLSPGTKSLILLGATGSVPIDSLGRWWSLISANYLHGGLIHLVFNMLGLLQLGPLCAREYGGARMFLIYSTGGTFGFLISYLAGVRLTIGASAALCTLIGAMLYYGKSRGGLYGDLIYRRIGGWALSIFLFGFLVPGINNWGHGGGLAAGLCLGYLLGYKEKRAETAAHRFFAGCLALVTVVILLWAGVSSLFYTVIGP